MKEEDIRNNIDKAVREFFIHSGKYPNILEISPEIYLKLESLNIEYPNILYVFDKKKMQTIKTYAGMKIFIKNDINKDYIRVYNSIWSNYE